ncbi:Vacuolar protease A [Mortierella alpina]|uniref:Vacuolar protease A n=1 Tax=Mortierella alpina TaxID=64518 RepID=A0A9P6JDI5_MORAP|nr:Vacuolar protease A [Mortierella alpina]
MNPSLWHPVQRQAFWEIEFTKVHLGEIDLDLKGAAGAGAGAIIDTSTSLSGLHSTTARTFNHQIGAQRHWFHKNLYTLDCPTVKHLPDLTLVFGKYNYTLQSSDYVLEIEGTC